MNKPAAKLSPSLRAGFERLHAQREAFFPIIEGAGMAELWRRPTDAGWAVGDGLLHLCKTMRVYRVLVGISWPVLFPVAWLCRHRPFNQEAVDIFAEYKAAGKSMKATWLLVPHRPTRLPSSHELREQLEVETVRMEDILAGMAEGIAGHYRIFDPGVGSPNLIQRVQLLAFHERRHFKIMERLLTCEAV